MDVRPWMPTAGGWPGNARFNGLPFADEQASKRTALGEDILTERLSLQVPPRCAIALVGQRLSRLASKGHRSRRAIITPFIFVRFAGRSSLPGLLFSTAYCGTT